MDGRAEGARIERDPTMDNRIVHAVCVSNKKEQCQLRDRERNLHNEFVVEQHIIRREEKSLLKQFHKLQLEKYHRHGDEMHSSHPGSRKLLLPQSTHERGSSHRVLVNSPLPSRYHLQLQHVSDRSSAHPSHVSMKHPSHPSSYLISNNGSSFASSRYSLHSGTDFSLPTIDKVRPGTSRESQYRKNADERHHSDRQHPHGTNNELESLMELYLVPRQPAGYGHSIKELSSHKDLHRYRVQKSKYKHRRQSVDFDYPGNYRHVGNLHLLNDIGPSSGISLSRLPQTETQSKKTGDVSEETPLKHPPIKQSKSSLNISTQKATEATDPSESKRVPAPGNEANEREKKITIPQNLQISIKISRNKRQDEKHAMQKTLQDTVTSQSTERGNYKTTGGKEGKKSTSFHSMHNFNRQAMNQDRSPATCDGSGSRDLVPFLKKPPSKEHIDEGASFTSQLPKRSNNDTHHKSQGAKVQETNASHPRDSELAAADTLAELEAICGSSTQGYFNQLGGFGNRRTRFKQLVKELLLRQMPAVTRKRHLAEFDPLEALQCRYLRLSPSNIEDLVAACQKAGVDVNLHPHSNVTDINEHVFGNKSNE